MYVVFGMLLAYIFDVLFSIATYFLQKARLMRERRKQLEMGVYLEEIKDLMRDFN